MSQPIFLFVEMQNQLKPQFQRNILSHYLYRDHCAVAVQVMLLYCVDGVELQKLVLQIELCGSQLTAIVFEHVEISHQIPGPQFSKE